MNLLKSEVRAGNGLPIRKYLAALFWTESTGSVIEFENFHGHPPIRLQLASEHTQAKPSLLASTLCYGNNLRATVEKQCRYKNEAKKQRETLFE
jgi:hypothetical protein